MTSPPRITAITEAPVRSANSAGFRNCPANGERSSISIRVTLTPLTESVNLAT